MLKSMGMRFVIVAALVVLMVIPMMMVGIVIDGRSGYSREAIHSVGEEWGGPQVISGPRLIVPVSGPATHIETRDVTDPATGATVQEVVEVISEVTKKPLYIYPTRFDATLDTQAQERKRGLFQVPVYTASADISFAFDVTGLPELVKEGETFHWDQAVLDLSIGSNRALRGQAALTADGVSLPLEPRADNQGGAGITAQVADAKNVQEFRLTLGFNGAQELMIAPVGRNSTVTMQSDWPHPSFAGAFLPDSSEISDQGFSAKWTIPHLARNLPQLSRNNFDHTARETAFGVKFYTPNDFYQKAYRAARYAILFIALTFLTVFLIEGQTQRPAHPVQYILIGLAQSVFVLLMLAYAEQIGFMMAYLGSSAATIALLVLFGATGLKLGKRTWVLGVMLVVLYGVLYLILQSADYALLAGASLAFVALAATMITTRNEDWYGPEPKPKPEIEE